MPGSRRSAARRESPTDGYEKHTCNRVGGVPAAFCIACRAGRTNRNPRTGHSEHGPRRQHALQNARLCHTRGVAGACGLSAKADSGQRRIAADAGEASAERAGLRQTGTRRLYGREGPARNASRLLSGRQSLSTARTSGSISGRGITAWPLALRPPREHGAGFRSRESHQFCQARLRRFHLRHGRPERYEPGPSRLARRTPGFMEHRIFDGDTPLEQHQGHRLSDVAARCRSKPDRGDRRVGRRHPDVFSDGGG